MKPEQLRKDLARRFNVRELRHALGLSQADMAELLCVDRATLWRIEDNPRKRLPRASALLLRIWLRDAELQARLVQTGVRSPWPEDWVALSVPAAVGAKSPN